MIDSSGHEQQIKHVTTFQELISTPFQGEMNAICWDRKLVGNFSEIIEKVEANENIVEINSQQLQALELSEGGQLAREILLKDLQLLKDHGASPVLNIIKCYERDDIFPTLPTDVYSYHVDRSPVPTDTFLCTYHGASSDILPNAQGEQKVLIPEIREALRKLHDGPEADFESFLQENFFDLHFRAKPDAQPISCGQGHVWKLAVDHPESTVSPCLHRAPEEKDGKNRLLLIC